MKSSTHAALAATTLALAATSSAAVLTPTADTYIDYENDVANFGSSNELVVSTLDENSTDTDNDGGKTKTAFVRFDVSNLPGPVINATFSAFRTSGRGDKRTRVYGVTDTAFESFSESGLTWSSGVNAGFVNNEDGTQLNGETDLGFFTTLDNDRNGTTFVLQDGDSDPTNDPLIAFINNDADGIIVLAIHDQQQNGNVFKFASRESTVAGGFAPTLTVTAIPEPAALSAVSLVGLLGLRRRRA